MAASGGRWNRNGNFMTAKKVRAVEKAKRTRKAKEATARRLGRRLAAKGRI